MSTKPPSPLRGEVWRVNFDPTLGQEIKKSRPAVVISSDAMGKLPVKLVVPITEWKEHFSGSAWLVKITPDELNHLNKVSAADCLQIRGMDTVRFATRLGRVSSSVLEEIAAAIAIVVEYS